MIIIENYGVNDDGAELVRTYSDRGMMIERDGILYSEAIDPAELNRRYTETDKPVVDEE